MFGSQALETVIGLVFFFLAISIFVTSVQEFLTTAVGLRSSTLKTGLVQLIAQGKNLKDLDGLGKDLFEHGNLSPSRAKAYVSAEDFTSAVVNVLSNDKPVTVVSDINARIAELPKGPLQDALNAAVVHAQDDLVEFKKQVANWFDNSMERLSGQYKLISGYLSLALGAILAFAFNLDAIRVVKALWVSEALRQQAAAVAAAQVASAKPTSANISADATLAVFDFHFNLLPDGWAFSWIALFGCAVTAFAVSLGAPFWFDILQNVMNLRGTGAKPVRADA